MLDGVIRAETHALMDITGSVWPDLVYDNDVLASAPKMGKTACFFKFDVLFI